MNIRPDAQNIRQLCELADFIDSGFQSFHEQVRSRRFKPDKKTEAAFYCGAALAMKLLQHFSLLSDSYPPGAPDYMAGLLMDEIDAYMERNQIKLEWEPHVPAKAKQ